MWTLEIWGNLVHFLEIKEFEFAWSYMSAQLSIEINTKLKSGHQELTNLSFIDQFDLEMLEILKPPP